MRFRIVKLVVCIFLSCCCVAATPTKVPYSQFVLSQVNTLLDQLQKDSDYASAIASAQALFDQTILYTSDDHLDAIRESDFALRLITQLQDCSATTRDASLPFLLKHQTLAGTMVFVNRAGGKDTQHIYKLLDELRQSRGEELEKYSTLTAAICMVHDRPLSRHINENEVTAIEPLKIFDYYVKNESRMFFGIRNVPAELLIYVVDTTATLADMNWALQKYAGTADVGKLFFDIDYDYEYLKRGTDKTVTTKGYTLPHILKYGGVCADQAYFASAVGKAIGVPTCYDVGISGEAAHAWVGFLQSNESTGFWNFNSGRYESFQGVRGTVLDPQIRKNVPDGYVSLLGEMIRTKSVDRQNAIALTDASLRLKQFTKDSTQKLNTPPPDTIVASTVLAKPRSMNVATQLALIELALRQSVAYPIAWFAVADLAQEKKLTAADKRRWTDLLLRLGASKYPDFTISMLMPIVQSIDQPQEQDAVWRELLPMFSTRLDISAAILMAEASLWESQKQTNRAGTCYLEVVERYTNGGPFVLTALDGAEKLLVSSNRTTQIVPMYERAWSKTKKPEQMAPEFMAESNWFRIGAKYAFKLGEAGQTGKAQEVATKLGPAFQAAQK